MPVKKFSPTSPGRRFYTVQTFDDLSDNKPLKSLVKKQTKSGGRNSTGRITSRFRGGGHKRRYRVVDFKRNKADVPGVVASVEYDPNRSARIALIHYADGEKQYILQPAGVKVGDTVISGDGADIIAGNCLRLELMPLGTTVHNIELKPGKGGQMARSAGAAAQLVAKEGNYAQLKLPSGEVRIVHRTCRATVGQVGNLEHENITIGKAGRKRWMGRKPHNRGVTMNPVDHPHGGGEGRTNGGRHPVTPWGVPTKGYKTRNNKRTNRFIVRRRGRK